MTELEKCMAGEYYNCHGQIFLDFKEKTRKLLKQYAGNPCRVIREINQQVSCWLSVTTK